MVGTYVIKYILIYYGSDIPIVNKVTRFFYRNTTNGIYRIRHSSGYRMTYCQMTSLTGCLGGGWTLVMKTDGRKVCTRKETVTLKQAFSDLYYV